MISIYSHPLTTVRSNLEAQGYEGRRALHYSFPVIQELISRYHVDINARRNDCGTVL